MQELYFFGCIMMNVLKIAEFVLKGCFFVELQGCIKTRLLCSLCPRVYKKNWAHHRAEHSAALLTSVEVIHRADHSETEGKHGVQQDQKHPERRQISTVASAEKR